MLQPLFFRSNRRTFFFLTNLLTKLPYRVEGLPQKIKNVSAHTHSGMPRSGFECTDRCSDGHAGSWRYACIANAYFARLCWPDCLTQSALKRCMIHSFAGNVVMARYHSAGENTTTILQHCYSLHEEQRNE